MGEPRKGRKRRLSGSSQDGMPGAGLRTLKYSVEEKLEIIEFAKGNGNRAAGREYNVAESSIREWRKNEEKLRNMKAMQPDKSLLNGTGRKLLTLTEQLEDIQRNFAQMHDVIRIPLINFPHGSLLMQQHQDHNTDDVEESLGGASSTKSSSPTLSMVAEGVSGTSTPLVDSSGRVAMTPTPMPYGSGRRKAKQPRKVICEDEHQSLAT